MDLCRLYQMWVLLAVATSRKSIPNALILVCLTFMRLLCFGLAGFSLGVKAHHTRMLLDIG